MRLPAALLLIGMGAALGGCGEAATAKVEVPVRIAPENDREIVVLIPQGSAVKISKCCAWLVPGFLAWTRGLCARQELHRRGARARHNAHGLRC